MQYCVGVVDLRPQTTLYVCITDIVKLHPLIMHNEDAPDMITCDIVCLKETLKFYLYIHCCQWIWPLLHITDPLHST